MCEFAEHMTEVGRLIASGRDADIYEFGRGRVLRRSRNSREVAGEARVIEYVRSRGYPAPEVFDVIEGGLAMVMQRLEGPTMLDAAAARPWRLGELGRTLAELHESLHALDGPEWLSGAPVGRGERVVHMDLHPLNVLMTADGPVVIDWTNAVRGDPRVDVVATWILLAAAEVPAGWVMSVLAAIGRRRLLEAFLGSFDRDSLVALLADVVEWKCRDPNMSELETQRLRALVEGPPRSRRSPRRVG